MTSIEQDVEQIRRALAHWVYDVQNKNDAEVQDNLAALARIVAALDRAKR
jgi:hypothetical protein